MAENASGSFRRIVTGHDAEGSAVIVSDAAPAHVYEVGGHGGPTFFELWTTRESPASIDRWTDEAVESGLVLAPPKHGTRIRVVDFPPEGAQVRALDEAGAQSAFAAMGGADALEFRKGAPHPLMHRTQTIDYAIVLQGEITLILDGDDTTVSAGDIVVQRGTNHAWANRSRSTCRMVFVLIDGEFADGL